MKKCFLTIIASFLGTAAVWAASFDVQDYGATGDGVTDDTLAIQKAFEKATACDMSYGEVFFPAGTYLISDTILARPNAPGTLCMLIVRGDKATIKQSNPAKDIIYFENSFRHLIEDLTFDGGKRQLKFWSNNIDSGHVTLRRCIFKNASSFAVEDALYKDNSNAARLAVLKPCEAAIANDGKATFKWVDEDAHRPFEFTSTLFRITQCEFINNAKSFFITSDWALLDNSKIETNAKQDGPAIVSLGSLMIENVEGLAHNNPEIKEQYWIKKLDCTNQYGVNFRNSKLLTDGAGWAAVHNFCKIGGNQNSFFFAAGSEFASAGSREKSLYYMEEIPNIIHVQNSKEANSKEVAILGMAKKFTVEDVQNDPNKLIYLLNDSNTNLNPKMPGFMAKLTDKPLPPEIKAEMDNFPSHALKLETMRKPIKNTLNLANYSGDMESRLNAAISESKTLTGLTEIILPNCIYTFVKPVELPSEIVLRVEGIAIVSLKDKAPGAIFHARDAKNIVIQNFYFYNCDKGIAAETNPATESQILVDNCSFYKMSGAAIAVLAGDGSNNLPNKSSLLVSNCTFTYSPVLIHNVQNAVMDCVWVSTDPMLKSTGSIINRGNLYMRGMCGVPINNTLYKNGKDVDMRSNDLRWIDNYGNIYIDRCRFGGEYGGLPMVVNFGKDNSIYIRESWLYHYEGNKARLTLVDLEAMPKRIVLENNMGWPEPHVMVIIRPGATGDIKDVLIETCNVAKRTITDLREKKQP